MSSFGDQLRAFGEKVDKNHVKIKRMSGFDLFSAVVMDTPVLKGVLRNNWFVDMGTPYLGTTDHPDKSGATTIAKANSKLKLTRVDVDIFITNNMAYGPRIEYEGYSGKAPEGMVRVNTARWDLLVEYNARKVNK